MTIKIQLTDSTNLNSETATAWVGGWINGSGTLQVLQSDGTFGCSSPTTMPFYKVSSVPTVFLSVATNGNDRLIFVVSKSQPDALSVDSVSNVPIQYTQYPYANPPGVAAPGPFDVFEFGMDAAADVSAVSGFGLNLSFTDENNKQYGVNNSCTRKAIGKAFTSFIANEAKSLPAANDFAKLLYDGPISPGDPTPPSVDDQYFGICDPNC